MAREHSLADTRDEGGYIGKVMRGSLQSDIESKVFNADEGDLLGPFPSPDENHFEIFTVNAKTTAKLDDETRDEVRRIVRDEWIAARAREHGIELM
jgi:peptidylprolyl isomerase